MKKHISTILIIIVFLIGLSVLLYPTLSNWYNKQKNSYVVSSYAEVVNGTDSEEFDRILEKARVYNKSLHAFPLQFVSGEPEDEAYIEALNVRDGMMGYILIEELGIKVPISHGTSEDVLQTEIGHLEGSSLPTGDEGNHTILTGHTGLPSAELFTDIHKLEVGDMFELHILNEVFRYAIFNISIVKPHEIELLQPIAGEDIVTLVTCTPYGVNSHRLLVQGERVHLEEDEVVVVLTKEVEKQSWTSCIPILAIPILAILLVLIIRSSRRGKKR